MNVIWGVMLLIGMIYGTLTGHFEAMTNVVITGAQEAVQLAVMMAGVMAFWCGLMSIAEEGGLLDSAVRFSRPFLRWIFPDIPIGHPALEAIALNCIANIFGLGWAATPAGLKAMQELEQLEIQRKSAGFGNERGIRTASNEMCTFLVLNISSLQLIPVNIIAYRTRYGSTDPSGIIGPAIAATLISSITGIIFCRCMSRRCR